MRYRISVWIALAGALWLAGCASTAIPPAEPLPAPPVAAGAAPVAVAPEAGAAAAPEPATPAVVAEPVARGSVGEPQTLVLPPISGNQAVIALLDRAHQDSEAGRRDAAGAALERALRIEPRNPWLWHELAQLRLAEGQYAQAVSLAQKSNSFARSDRSLQSRNWRLIGNARVAQGNHGGAEQALQRAAALGE